MDSCVERGFCMRKDKQEEKAEVKNDPIELLKIRFVENMQGYPDEKRICKKCGSQDLIKYGKTAKGIPRFKCNKCGVTSTLYNHNLQATSYGDKIILDNFVDCMIEHKSLRNSTLICNISMSTALKWRYLFFETLDILYSKDQDLFYLDRPILMQKQSDDECKETEKYLDPDARVNQYGWERIYLRNISKYWLLHKFEQQAAKYYGKVVEEKLEKFNN